MTVKEMLRRMDSAEISEWKVYWQIRNSEMDQIKAGGGTGGSVKVTTMAGAASVEEPE
jgi:hypothetical protein